MGCFLLSSFLGFKFCCLVPFNFHWHQLISYSVSSTTALSSNISSNISSASILNSWFRDYLWFNLSSLIRGYDLFGSNDLGIWAWTFLLAHLCWVVSFMFLISWRGHWQELIDSVTYLHLKTLFLSISWTPSFSSPIALSIVQARFIGSSHLSVGYILTYAAFLIISLELHKYDKYVNLTRNLSWSIILWVKLLTQYKHFLKIYWIYNKMWHKDNLFYIFKVG